MHWQSCIALKKQNGTKVAYNFANDRLVYHNDCRVTSLIDVSVLVSLVEGGTKTNNIDRGYFIKASRG